MHGQLHVFAGNDFATSFTNPNFALNRDDVINCNLPYCDNSSAMSGTQQHDNVTSHTGSGLAPAAPASGPAAATSLHDELDRCRLTAAGGDDDGCMPMSVDGSVVASPITEGEGGVTMPAPGAAQGGLTNGSHPSEAR